jgi:hypothetical protein
MDTEERFDLAVVTDLKNGSQVKASRRVIHTATQEQKREIQLRKELGASQP